MRATRKNEPGDCGTYHNSHIVACMQIGRFSVSLFQVFQVFQVFQGVSLVS